MEAILAGREDYAAALTDLGFSDKGFSEALRAGSNRHQLDEYSGNARIVKAAMCAGAKSRPLYAEKYRLAARFDLY